MRVCLIPRSKVDPIPRPSSLKLPGRWQQDWPSTGSQHTLLSDQASDSCSSNYWVTASACLATRRSARSRKSYSVRCALQFAETSEAAIPGLPTITVSSDLWEVPDGAHFQAQLLHYVNKGFKRLKRFCCVLADSAQRKQAPIRRNALLPSFESATSTWTCCSRR